MQLKDCTRLTCSAYEDDARAAHRELGHGQAPCHMPASMCQHASVLLLPWLLLVQMMLIRLSA
jgi:hypothetical protein